MKKAAIVIACVLCLGIAYVLVSPLWRTVTLEEPSPIAPKPAAEEVVMETNEPMPASPAVVSQGAFVAKAHDVSGRAMLIRTGDAHVLRFEDFETINGPDVRVYLSSGLGIEDAIDLGPIRATKGSVNYEIPAGTDTAKYPHVLVWCRAFRVLFSEALLQSL